MHPWPRQRQAPAPATRKLVYQSMPDVPDGLSSNDQRLQTPEQPDAHHHHNNHHPSKPQRPLASSEPSLCYASSSAQSFPEDDDEAHRTPADSLHALDRAAAPHAALHNAKRMFSERSLLRVLSPPAEPLQSDEEASTTRSDQQNATATATAPAPTQRLRLHSGHPSLKPRGFPYCNSPNVLFQQQQQQPSDWRVSLNSQNSSANSSDDVDLDLSWDPTAAAAAVAASNSTSISKSAGHQQQQQQQHVGIDMGMLSIPEHSQQHNADGEQGPSPPHLVSPLSFLGSSSSRCRSNLDLRTRAKLDAADPSLHMSGRPDSFLTEGWSFNRTQPSPDPSGRAAAAAAAESHGSSPSLGRRSSGSLRNKRAVVPAPLRIWLDRSPRMNSPHPHPHSAPVADTPPTLGAATADSSFGSPSTSHGPITPRTPADAQMASRVEVIEGGVDEHSQEGHIGQFSSLNLSEFGSFGQGLVHSSTVASSAYKTAQSMPTSLTGAVEELSSSSTSPSPSPSDGGLQGLGFQHVHFPDSVDERPPASARLNPNPSPRLRPVDRSPRSDVSHSPNPDSPLMSGDALQQQQQQQQQQQRRHRLGTHRLSAFLPTTGSRADLPTASTSASSQRRSLAPAAKARSTRSHLREWLDDMAPAKTCFVLGFLAMPWLWFIGGWLLRPDGEFWGTRGAPCRCSSSADSAAAQKAGLHCPADVHRSLRLLGVQASGDGLMHDVHQLNSEGQNKAALLNIQTKQASGFILANRVAALTASAVVLAVFVAALVALCRALASA